MYEFRCLESQLNVILRKCSDTVILLQLNLLSPTSNAEEHNKSIIHKTIKLKCFQYPLYNVTLQLLSQKG